MNEDTRKALELAREALENFWLNSPTMQSKLAKASQAIAAIDAALSGTAAPAAPVAQPLTFAEFMSALADAGVVIDTDTAIRIKEIVEAQHGITKGEA